MDPPPAYSQSPPRRVLEPKILTTAASLKKFILRRDRIFASFLVKFVLRNFESLTFETPEPLAWPFIPVQFINRSLTESRDVPITAVS